MPNLSNISSWGSGSTLDVKSLDCVDVAADTINCNSLVINGESIEIDASSLSDVQSRTQNLTATPGYSDFSGSTTVDTLAGNSLSGTTVLANTLATDSIIPYLDTKVTVTGRLASTTNLATAGTTWTAGDIGYIYSSTNFSGTLAIPNVNLNNIGSVTITTVGTYIIDCQVTISASAGSCSSYYIRVNNTSTGSGNICASYTGGTINFSANMNTLSVRTGMPVQITTVPYTLYVQLSYIGQTAVPVISVNGTVTWIKAVKVG